MAATNVPSFRRPRLLFLAPWYMVALLSSPVSSQTAHTLCVANRGDGRILRFDGASGVPLGSIFDGGRTATLGGIASGPDGHIYAIAGLDVLRFDGRTGQSLGVFVRGAGALLAPQDLAFSPHDGSLFISDSEGDRILRFNGMTGELIGAFAPIERGDPAGLAFGPADGNLYVVAPPLQAVILVEGRRGAILGSFAGGRDLVQPVDLAFGPGGHLYVSASGTHEVKRYDGRTGAFLGTFFRPGLGGLASPSGLAFGPDEDLYVSSAGSDAVKRYDGSTGEYLGDFADASDGLLLPGSIAFHATAVTTSPEIHRVEPFHLSSDGTTEIRIRGANLTRSMQVFFHGSDPDLPPASVEFTFASAELIQALAPPYPPGIVDAAVRVDGREVHRLPNAAQYASPWAPAPEEIETTIVDGRTPSFRWRNAVAYREIHVYRDGSFVRSLPGDATSFVDEVGLSRDRARYRIVGTTEQGFAAIAEFLVAVPRCDPPPGHGTADRGPADFRLPGGHAPFQPGPGKVAAAEAVFSPSIVSLDEKTKVPYFQAIGPDLLTRPSEFLTGFTLLQEARKLRIEVHGAKIAAAAGGSLRLRIESMTPSVTRAAELVMPDRPLETEHEWMDLTYNTENPDPATRTISVPPNPADPAKDPPFPAADYRVAIYAVGGEKEETYYTISSDVSTDQIPVPKVGCAPYPLVRVTDTTGRNSAPVIVDVLQDPASETMAFFPVAGAYVGVFATLLAKAHDPDGDPVIRYAWKILLAKGTSVKESAGPKLLLLFPDYGYYDVELTVEDNRCGESTRRFEVKIHPPIICPPSAGEGPNFTFPSPRPDQLHHVPDLPGGMDLPLSVSETFRIFVVDACQGDPGTVQTKHMLVALDDPGLSGLQPLTFLDAAKAVAVAKAVNPGDPSTARFWEAKLSDLGRVPAFPPAPGSDPPRFEIDLIARAAKPGIQDPLPDVDAHWKPWRPVRAYGKDKKPVATSGAIHFYPKPAYLDFEPAFTFGYYDPLTRTYSFRAETTPPSGGAVSFPPTPSIPLPKGTFPSFKNRFSSVSQRAMVSLKGGIWSLDRVRLGVEGVALNGEIEGSTDLIGGGQGKAEGGAVSGADPFDFSDCRRQVLFNHSYDTTIFQGVVWEGPLPPPVYVRLHGSVHLGVKLALDTYSELRLKAFGADPYRAVFAVCPEGEITVGGSVKTDFFYGVASVEVGFDVKTLFEMPFQVSVDGAGFHGPDAGLRVSLGVDGWAEGCLGFGLVCEDVGFTVLPYNSLLTVGNPDLLCPTCGGGGKASGKGDPPTVRPEDHQLALATSPNGYIQVLVGIFPGVNHPEDPPRLAYLVRYKGDGWRYPFRTVDQILPPGTQRDPAVIFLDDYKVLVAWTQNYAHLDPALANLDPNVEKTPDLFNKITRRDEVVCRVGTIPAPQPIVWGPVLSLSDDAIEADLRADGKVTLGRLPAAGDAWAAWVRFETPDMLAVDGTGQAKVSMRKTSIFARRIAGGAPAGPEVRVSGTADGIDVEPSLGVSPQGVAYLVWLHDALHDDLISSNKGRNILLSTNAGGGWSAGQPIISDVSTLPGLLEPEIAVKETGYAMVAFSALPANASEEDTGIGNTRLLYTIKLIGGVWQQPPTYIFTRCETPIFMAGATILPAVPPVPIDPGAILIPPDFAIVLQETGALGTRAGAGTITAFAYHGKTGAWGDPIALTPDERTHGGMAATLTPAGELVIVGQSLPLAHGKAESVSAIGGLLLADDILAQEIPIASDPAITALRISDRYGAAGQEVRVTIGIENRGLASTPSTRDGRSLLSLAGSFLRPDSGDAEERFAIGLPVLAPNEQTFESALLVLPAEPVLLRVEIRGDIPGEIRPEDNARVLSLGTPAPGGLACAPIRNGARRGVRLSWTSPSAYDRILIYRDGAMLAELPGGATSFTDSSAGLQEDADFAGLHEYAVRGEIGRSRSLRASCSIEIPPLPTEPIFRRGDGNSDGNLDLGDMVFSLNYQFASGPAPRCLKAADLNDDGAIDLGDPISGLNYLFASGLAPRPPFEECGADPTADSLGCDAHPSCGWIGG